MKKAKRITFTPYKHYVNCEEKNCPWNRVCANHITAGDFRSEDGAGPTLVLRKGVVYCETFYEKGDNQEWREWPVKVNGIGITTLNSVVEEVDSYSI